MPEYGYFKRIFDALMWFQSHEFNAILARTRGLSIIDEYDLDKIIEDLRVLKEKVPDQFKDKINEVILLVITLHHRNSTKEGYMKDAQERLKSVVDIMSDIDQELKKEL